RHVPALKAVHDAGRPATGKALRALRAGRAAWPPREVVFEVLHTPGHTPEHVSLLVRDRSAASFRPAPRIQ
ncbi:MAG: hypothetical protein ABR511_00530, partial [Acidimicrobiales bacterium]